MTLIYLAVIQESGIFCRFFTTKDENVINGFLNIIKVSENLDVYIIVSLK